MIIFKQNLMMVRMLALIIWIGLYGCNAVNKQDEQKPASETLVGTWKLLSGTTISNGDTTVTDYTTDRSFIKIINNTHFAFLNHDLNKGKDSLAAYGSGGGSYILQGDQYTEHLEYCTDRAWEGHDFKFKVEINNDTLVQSGVEIVESEGINRMNIEKYIRVKQ